MLKKCVLELGGADAYLVLEDADMAAAAKVAATARMVNGGQSCIAGKRFIVVRSVLEPFEQAFVGAMHGYSMGDPTRPGTRLGPMQSVKARDEIHRQVEESIAKGARLLLGGQVPDKPGAWYPATILADVEPGQPAHDEEVFGPVAAIIAADDEADAIRIANASEFGLGSGVLTSDLDRGRRIAAHELEAGSAFVNENVRSDPRTPFGGVKHSGYGRECSAFGIREFTNIKTVHVKPDGRRREQQRRIARRGRFIRNGAIRNTSLRATGITAGTWIRSTTTSASIRAATSSSLPRSMRRAGRSRFEFAICRAMARWSRPQPRCRRSAPRSGCAAAASACRARSCGSIARRAGLHFVSTTAVDDWLPGGKRGVGQQMADELVHRIRLGESLPPQAGPAGRVAAPDKQRAIVPPCRRA